MAAARRLLSRPLPASSATAESVPPSSRADMRRRESTEGVLVVSDGERVLEPVSRSGDEPQLLARTVSGVPVLVSSDRYIAGCSRSGNSALP